MPPSPYPATCAPRRYRGVLTHEPELCIFRTCPLGRPHLPPHLDSWRIGWAAHSADDAVGRPLVTNPAFPVLRRHRRPACPASRQVSWRCQDGSGRPGHRWRYQRSDRSRCVAAATADHFSARTCRRRTVSQKTWGRVLVGRTSGRAVDIGSRAGQQATFGATRRVILHAVLYSWIERVTAIQSGQVRPCS